MSNNFMILFSVDFGNKREASRMVLLRQYIESGFGPGISLIDEALVSENRTYPFVVIAAAESKEVLETALNPCKDVYSIQIFEVSSFNFNNVVIGRYCLLVNDKLRKSIDINKDLVPLTKSLLVRTLVQLPEESPFSSLWIVDAPSCGYACNILELLLPGAFIYGRNAITASQFFENKFAPSFAAEETPIANISERNLTNGAGNYFIYNEDKITAYNADTSPYDNTDSSSYYKRFLNVEVINASSSNPVLSNVYIFKNKLSKATYIQKDIAVNLGPSPNLTQMTVATSYPVPDICIRKIEDQTVGFNLSAKTPPHPRTELWVWLNDLLFTDKYDKPWPEDSYTGESLLAYKYFLTILPSIPKDGNLSSAEFDLNSVKNYPNDVSFSKEVFENVYDHLLQECIYFEDANRWFGTSGNLTMINTQIAVISNSELTAAIHNMSIQHPDDSYVFELVDDILTEIMSLVAVIPVYGAAISAVLAVGWTSAKFIIDRQNPKKDDTPIKTSIAQMAITINNYLIAQIEASQEQLSSINSNWGKLQSFGNAKETGKISEKEFGIVISNGSSILPESYIMTAQKAWRIIIYQSLFSVNHKPTSNISFASNVNGSDIPKNPWNPAKGQFDFVYAIPCYYFNGTNDNNHKGFAIFTCQTDAPNEVKQLLFGTESESLNVDPFEFFIGFNGWSQVIPVVVTVDGRGNDPYIYITSFGW